MAAFSYEAFEELPARNVYDEVARQFSEATDKVWRLDFIGGTTYKADVGGMRRAVRNMPNVRVVTLKGVLYLERM